MAHNRNAFERMFDKYSIKRTDKGIRIDINYKPIGMLLDYAQEELDKQVWHDMQMYMPKREGAGHLVRQTNALNKGAAGTGEVHVYDPMVEYAHYVYEGEKYVDPVYRKGGFYSPEYGFWSRPGVKKVPSGEPLFYTNPKAEAHWDDVTIARHEKQWLNMVRRILS